MKLLLEWLSDGQIPVVNFEGRCHYAHSGAVHGGLLPIPSALPMPMYQPLEWVQARSHGRFWVQIFEERIDRFLKFLAKGTPDGLLYLPIRSTYEFEGLEGRHLLIGAAVFPEPIESDAIIEGDLALIQRFCLLGEERSEPTDCLKNTWRSLQVRKQQSHEQHERFKRSQARSLGLLLSQLDESQAKELNERHRFTMLGRDGQRYLITYRQHGNVWLLGADGKPVTNYCIVNDDVPIYDQMLGQKLLLENDLEAFLRIANATPVGPTTSSDPDPNAVGDTEHSSAQL